MPQNKLPDDLVFDLPEPTTDTKKDRLSLWATYYYVYSAETVAAGQPLLDQTGSELGPKLTVRDFCLAAVEGTVRVGSSEAGVVYNYAGRANVAQVDCSGIVPHLPDNIKAALGKTRWVVAKAPFGSGVEGMILVPFRTIAVDPGRIAYGSVIYIPQARGQEVTLPSGSVATHDGYFFAADTGGAIKQNHIDVFAGINKNNPFPRFIKSDSAATFEAFLIDDPRILSILQQLHGGVMEGYLSIDSSVSRLNGVLLIRKGTANPTGKATEFLEGDPRRLGNGDYIKVTGTDDQWMGERAIAITEASRTPPPV